MSTPVISTGNHPKLLWPGLKKLWGMEYDKHEDLLPTMFDMETSDKAYEELVELTSFGVAPVKPEGGTVVYDTHSQAAVTRATHVAYALATAVTKEEIDDNLYMDKGGQRVRALAFSMFTTKQIVGANVYNRATDSNYTGGDGVELLSTAHPTAAGNQSNELATAADLSEASLEDIMIQITTVKNSKGHQIYLQPRCLLVHPNDWFEANRIVTSQLQNDTANNAINVIRSTGALPEGVKQNPYLTDTDQWFVRTNAMNGMTCFMRSAIEFDQDNDFGTKNALMSAYERYSFVWGDWRTVFGSPGA